MRARCEVRAVAAAGAAAREEDLWIFAHHAHTARTSLLQVGVSRVDTGGI